MDATGCDRTAATTIVARMLTMKIAVGIISSLADSVIPNMFTAVRITSPTMLTSSRWSSQGREYAPQAGRAGRQADRHGQHIVDHDRRRRSRLRLRPRLALETAYAPPPSGWASITWV